MRKWLFLLTLLAACLTPIDKGRLLFKDSQQNQQDLLVEFLRFDEACLKRLTVGTREAAEARTKAYQAKQERFAAVRARAEVSAHEVSSQLFYSSTLSQEEIDEAIGKMTTRTQELRAALKEVRDGCR